MESITEVLNVHFDPLNVLIPELPPQAFNPPLAASRYQRTRSTLGRRWGILALVCVIMTGVYYSYDIPAALHQQLYAFMPPSTNFETHFNLLYTVYSVPNVILPFFGGKFVDRFGASFCLVSFASLTLLGQLLFAFGTEAKSWGIMLLGRIIYGFGGESIVVAQSTLLSSWFDGGEVAFAMGISLAVSRLGSVFNNMISPFIANSTGTIWALFVGVAMNSFSVWSAIAVAFMDRDAEQKCTAENEAKAVLMASLLEDDSIDVIDEYARQDSKQNDTVSSENVNDSVDETTEHVRLGGVLQFGPVFWLLALSSLVVYGCILPFNNVASGILLERNYFRAPPKDCVLDYPEQCTLGSLQNGTNLARTLDGELCQLQYAAPLLPSSISFTQTDKSWKRSQYNYTSLRPSDVDCGDSFWSSACTKDYCSTQKQATEKAGRIMSIPYLFSAALSPVLGKLVDKIGRRATIACFASLILIMVHTTLALSISSPVVPLVGQGIAYSLYAAVIWPSIPLVVDKKLTGTAFGVMLALQNVGLSLFPILIAGIYNSDGHHYIPNVEYFFVSCAVIGTGIGIALQLVDQRRGGKLNATNSDRNERTQ
uniref:Lysosomal dipeptide transporter MFSD1 n=1 Tax=Attheya septentrionalis TaxID=420275 RepID=A0A7S2U807_9STRA|mmetsp:Transcript_1448/g.2599  ORF Transcript_1448/g.2599 Transcript_1448/m.2599 type:complete len:596 (+) Transcript_1448:130-1917(+)|eukprot:CAMPEP_0198281784 /NCGR_PEP_ID=MMETSP1449-20131203/1656_1 /TAXON_ID=420275 /ORGANISM="Attheya septentrionalis, Strain CCMP2084" /LENGTH=595 /DNA_ID=CAMNT_0043977703 /DNA_START=70 /DNA_END=1857 /DNA_ORIENTATION=-